MPLTIEASEHDLQQFSQHATAGGSKVDVLGPRGRRLHWDSIGRSGRVTSVVLDSGIALSVSTVDWDRPWSVSIDQNASALKFTLLRGRGPRLTTSDGGDYSLRGGAFHLACVHRPVRMTFDFDEPPVPAHHEQLSVEIEPKRLAALLGVSVLPAPIERVLADPRAYPAVALPMGPALVRVFDEIAGGDERGISWKLHLEAMGLELVAAVIDRLEQSARAELSHLSAHERERLEAARRLLLARMVDPPSVPALARAVGLNEFKLKAGFRALFGSPVFTYLRARRMDEAWRLLGERRYTVTEGGDARGLRELEQVRERVPQALRRAALGRVLKARPEEIPHGAAVLPHGADHERPPN